MRIEKRSPMTDLSRVWGNLWSTPVSDRAKSDWYTTIHDIVPTRERLHNINLTQSAKCTRCNGTDTLSHRIMECGTGPQLWSWTREKIATIMRIAPRWVPESWLFRPSFRIWPAKKCRAVLWLLACLVEHRTGRGASVTLQEYLEVLARTRWRLYRQSDGQSLVGNYLSVMDG